MASPADVEPGHGLVLLRGTVSSAEKSLRRGLVAVHAVQYPEWVGVTPAESRARSVAPYDVGLEVLAARPVARANRAALGFFVLGGCAVVTVHPRALRPVQRWLIWQPGSGPRTTPHLASMPVDVLIDAAGAHGRANVDDIAAAVADPSGTPLDFLVTLLRLLGLPGEDLLVSGADESAVLLEPSARSVRAFDAIVAQSHDHDLSHQVAR